MKISFSGFEEFNDKLTELSKAGNVKRNQFAAQQAEILIGHVKDNTPTDTGQLKNSWKRTRAENGVVQVFTNCSYAAHVEFGHRIKNFKGQWTGNVVPGKKMLHLGMLQTGKSFEEDAKTILRGLLE